MIAPFPPDDGLSIPKHRHQQLDVLTRMFGEPLPTPAPAQRGASSLLDGLTLHSLRVVAGPTFTPTPGTLDDARKPGQLFWHPYKLPHEHRVGWHRVHEDTDPRTIYIQVTHAALDGSRRPKTPAACAALCNQIAEYGDRMGTYSVTLDQAPDQWTIDAIKDLAFLMDALLPPDAATNDKETRFHVRAYKSLEVRRADDYRSGFLARVQFFSASHHVTRDWCRAFGDWFNNQQPCRHTDHALSEIDDLQPRGQQTVAPQKPIDHDDDDLDDIEKAARQALHGSKNIPRRTAADSSFVQTARRLELVAPPAAIEFLERTIQKLTADYEQGGERA